MCTAAILTSHLQVNLASLSISFANLCAQPYFINNTAARACAQPTLCILVLTKDRASCQTIEDHFLTSHS